jgi:8-amino-7-oxononanoate synthase
MLDFTSSLYLGLRHECRSLEPWAALTLGRPAALQEPGEAVAAAQALASLAGCAAGTLLPSTFHLFWDLLGVLSREPIEIYMDAATYPIARWSAEHWAGKGVPLWPFPRHDATQLGRLLGRRRARPLVLCDGVCVGSHSQPPLAAYAALAHRHGGWLVVDDTQGLGVFGHSPSPTAPYGLAGGGSLQRHAIGGDHVVIGASLSKGFGVPIALLAGSRAVLSRFERESASREHMSPPSMAAIHAARHALAVNRHDGDRLRLRLWRAVRRLRVSLAALGVGIQSDAFPVQTLAPSGTDVRRLHHELLRHGVRTVLHDARRGRAQLSFIVTAGHSAAHIDRAVAQLALALRAVGPGTSAASTPYVDAGPPRWSH